MTRKTLLHLHCPLQNTDPLAQRIAAVQAAQDFHRMAPNLAVITHTELTQSNWAASRDDQRVMDYLWLKRNERFYPYFGGGVKRGHPVVGPANANAILYDPNFLTYKAGSGKVLTGTKGLGGVGPTRTIDYAVLSVNGTPAAGHFWAGHAISGVESGARPRTYRKSSFNNYLGLCRQAIKGGTIPSIGALDANHTRFPELLRVNGATFPTTGPTHGNRRIDWVVGYRMGRQVGKNWMITLGKAKTFQLPYNDHRSILTEIHIDY